MNTNTTEPGISSAPRTTNKELHRPPQKASSGARYDAPILESEAVGPAFHRLRIACDAIARAARPGQFVHVLPRLPGQSASHDPLLRRAFSIMSTGPLGQEGAAESGGWFEILFRVGGKGTALLARLRTGDSLDVLGPLGNGFSLGLTGRSEGPHGGNQRPLFLVGGGIGVPPLLFVAQAAGRSGSAVSRETRVEAFVGARTRGELVGVDALRAAGASVHVATDDGSEGRRGLVTLPLRERLEEVQAGERRRQGGGEESGSPLVLVCGPWPMLRAVAQVCEQAQAECRVSLEESMPCGVGVCNGCVVPVRGASDDYGLFQRICVHGPVLDAREVDWGGAGLLPPGPSVAPPTDDDMEAPAHRGASQ